MPDSDSGIAPTGSKICDLAEFLKPSARQGKAKADARIARISNYKKPTCNKHDRPGTSKFCGAFSECCASVSESNEVSLAPIFLANLGDPSLVGKINKIKAKCETERKEAESENNAGTKVKSLLSQMMGVVNHQNNRDWRL